MARRQVVIAVDRKFFNRFDRERRNVQARLGIKNLSQFKFSEMIAKNPSQNIFPKLNTKPFKNVKTKKGRR